MLVFLEKNTMQSAWSGLVLTAFLAMPLVAFAEPKALFNDRAVGVKEQGYVMIKGRPCGKRAGDCLLFCMTRMPQ